ncbi:energy-coupling factor ABC transporter ATP-binding protein [Agrilactobacillus fermenti]|uniref:energy-coupling factor ABC transporter ATP-binding protein n=1 Tax=Agrilactobacillus fermenti TaxID=2586909 RepID=UPI003A5C4D60
MAVEKFVALDRVSVKYPNAQNWALDWVSMSVPQFAKVGIIGNSDAGKTTFCQLLAGIIPEMIHARIEGQLQIDRNDTKQQPSVGYVFQDPESQMSGLAETVADEIAFGLINAGFSELEIDQRVKHVAKELELTSILHQSPTEISGGQQQRLALATVLVVEPDILILDNPTSQMDPQGKAWLFEHLATLKKQTIFLVSDEIDLLCEFADYLGVFAQGKLLAFDTPAHVINQADQNHWPMALPTVYQFAKALSKTMAGTYRYPVTLGRLKRVMHNDDD